MCWSNGTYCPQSAGWEHNGNRRLYLLPLSACVFTYPGNALVGQLVGRRIGTFPLTASAKASCLGDSRGFVKVFDEGGIIVGVLIFAPHAGEIIAEAAHAVRLKLKIEDVFHTIHAHPTLPESFLEAARDVNNNAIDLSSRK